MAGWSLEAQERKIRWPQWSADSVEKFLEWLYTGDYSIPLPTKARQVAVPQKLEAETPGPHDDERDTDEAVEEDFPMELQEEEWNRQVPPETYQVPAHRIEKASVSSSAPTATPTAKGPLTALKDLEWKGSHAVQTTSGAENFTNHMNDTHLASSKQLDYDATFMTHAILYVIGCEKDLHELKNMAWQRLRSLLVEIGAPETGSPIIGNMVALIQYTYSETGVSELPVEPLRDLVTSYVAIHFTNFRGAEVDALFSSQAADDREFVVEVMAKVRQSMENFETKSSEVTKTTPDERPYCTICGIQRTWSYTPQGYRWRCRCCN